MKNKLEIIKKYNKTKELAEETTNAWDKDDYEKALLILGWVLNYESSNEQNED